MDVSLNAATTALEGAVSTIEDVLKFHEEFLNRGQTTHHILQVEELGIVVRVLGCQLRSLVLLHHALLANDAMPDKWNDEPLGSLVKRALLLWLEHVRPDIGLELIEWLFKNYPDWEGRIDMSSSEVKALLARR